MKEVLFWLKLAASCVVLAGVVFFVVMKMALAGGTVDVPQLVGLGRATAVIQLKKQGLGMVVMEERFSNTAPYGTILEQDTEAGITVKRGREIQVVVSMGTREVQVPELVGMRSSRQARLLLEQNGLVEGVVAHIHHASPLDSVVAQSPEAGLEVSRGSRVSLLVSAEPEKKGWVMPPLKGRDLGEARGLIKSMGLVLRSVSLREDPQAVPGSLLEQSLPAGLRVEQGQEVELTVAKGDPATSRARFALLEYQVPDVGVAERRVQVTVTDARGHRVVYNAMEKPGASVRVETKAWGGAVYTVHLAGQEVEEKEIP